MVIPRNDTSGYNIWSRNEESGGIVSIVWIQPNIICIAVSANQIFIPIVSPKVLRTVNMISPLLHFLFTPIWYKSEWLKITQ